MSNRTERSDRTPSPEDVTRIRATHRIRCEFLYQQNVLDENNAPHSRRVVRDAIERLSVTERKALYATLQTRLRELETLMDNDIQTFPGPKVRHDDLEGVRLVGFHDHY